jgi:hypothetical protein
MNTFDTIIDERSAQHLMHPEGIGREGVVVPVGIELPPA